MIKINEMNTNTIVKNYIEVEFNNDNYLITTNELNKVRYISKCIPNKKYNRGYELEPVHTNSIKNVFGITKREFDNMINEFNNEFVNDESVSILDDISSIEFFGNCEIGEIFAKQWDKVIKSAVEQKETIVFENQSFSLNVIARVGLDTYVLPLNETMKEFDKNFLMQEFTNIVNDLYNLKAKYKKIDTTAPTINPLPF